MGTWRVHQIFPPLTSSFRPNRGGIRPHSPQRPLTIVARLRIRQRKLRSGMELCRDLVPTMRQSCSIKFGTSFAYVTDDVQRAKKPKHLPVVFTREEVRVVLAQLGSTLAHSHAHVRSRFETAGLFATEHTRCTHIDFSATDHGIDARVLVACPGSMRVLALFSGALFFPAPSSSALLARPGS